MNEFWVAEAIAWLFLIGRSPSLRQDWAALGIGKCLDGESFPGLAGAFQKYGAEAEDIVDPEDSERVIRTAMNQKAWSYGGVGVVTALNLDPQINTGL